MTYLAGLITISLFNVFAQWAYAIKRTQMPMWIILASNLVNILGNYLLIYGKCGLPEMGLLGAGCSTLLARAICPVAIICVFLFHKGFRPYRTGFSKARLSGTELKRIFSTSLPVSLQMTFETGSFALTVEMAGWLGALSLAALQVILIISMLGFCVYYSIGVSISVLVANACGLGDGRLMRHTAFAGYHLILFLTVVASTVFLLLGGAMIRAFTTDMAVISLASTLIFPLVLYQLGDATQITFANALRGTSNVMPMLWISFFCYLVIGIPAAYLLAFTANLGVYGIILSYAAGLFPAAGLYLFFFLRSTAPRRERIPILALLSLTALPGSWTTSRNWRCWLCSSISGRLHRRFRTIRRGGWSKPWPSGCATVCSPMSCGRPL